MKIQLTQTELEAIVESYFDKCNLIVDDMGQSEIRDGTGIVWILEVHRK